MFTDRTTRTLAGLAGALTLAATLAACGGGNDAAATDSAAGVATVPAAATDSAAMGGAMGSTGMAGTAAGGTLVADTESATTALEGGITSVAPAVAIPLIQRIEDQLDATNVEPLDEIATDLEKLREELNDGSIDGGEVANVLGRLGEKVTALSGNAQAAGAAGPTLQRLGAALTKGAQALRGS